MKKTILICSLVVLLAGCQTYTFDKPQPRDSAPLSSFPDCLPGYYSHISGTERMEITDHLIIISSQSRTDSFTTQSGERDTVFAISDTAVLKTWHGYYFLSRRSDKTWFVFSMKPENNMLILGNIKDSADIAALKQISPHKCDSTGCVFRPTQKQFIKYVKGNGFRDKDTFMRVVTPADI